jgi:hypothetical protein
LHSWITTLGQQSTEAETERPGVLRLTYPSDQRPLKAQFAMPK